MFTGLSRKRGQVVPHVRFASYLEVSSNGAANCCVLSIRAAKPKLLNAARSRRLSETMGVRVADVVNAVCAGLTIGVMEYVVPSDWQGFVLRAGCATALFMSIERAASQICASVLLHGQSFGTHAQRVRLLFSRTRISGAYRNYRQQALNGGVLLFALIIGHQPSVVVVFLATLYILQLKTLWWAVRHVPPSVLVLGPASRSLVEEVDHLRTALRPHRIVLMFPSDRRISQFEEIVPQLVFNALDNFRTTYDDEWKNAFSVLLDAAPVVLVDGRSSTANLEFEAEAVAKTRGKAVFVISANGPTALIDNLGESERAFYSQRAVRIAFMNASAVQAGLDAVRLAKASRPVLN